MKNECQAAERSFFLTHNLTCGATISMSRAVFTSIFPHLSLTIIPNSGENVKFFSMFFLVAGVGVEPTKTGL